MKVKLSNTQKSKTELKNDEWNQVIMKVARIGYYNLTPTYISTNDLN